MEIFLVTADSAMPPGWSSTRTSPFVTILCPCYRCCPFIDILSFKHLSCGLIPNLFRGKSFFNACIGVCKYVCTHAYEDVYTLLFNLQYVFSICLTSKVIFELWESLDSCSCMETQPKFYIVVCHSCAWCALLKISSQGEILHNIYLRGTKWYYRQLNIAYLFIL